MLQFCTQPYSPKAKVESRSYQPSASYADSGFGKLHCHNFFILPNLRIDETS